MGRSYCVFHQEMKLIHAIMWSGILGGYALIFTVLFWVLYPYNILTFHAGNGTILTPRVKSGEYIQMRQNSCKHMKLKSEVNRQFIDGIVYQVPTFINNRPVGCYDVVEYIYIPKAIPPGEIKIYTTITFRPNPLRSVTYTVETGSFIVY